MTMASTPVTPIASQMPGKSFDKAQLATQAPTSAEDANKTIQLLETKMANLEEELNQSYNDTLDQMVAQITALQKQLQASKKDVAQWKRAAEQAAEQQEQVEQALEEAQQAQQQRQPAQPAMDQQALIAQHEQEQLNMRTKLSELQASCTVADQVAVFLRSQLSTTEQQADTIRDRCCAVQQQLSTVQTDLSAAEKTIYDLKFSAKEKERIQQFVVNKLQTVTAEKDQQNKQSLDLQQQVQDLSTKLKKATDQACESQYALTGTTRVLKYVQSSLQTAQQTAAATEKELQNKVSSATFEATGAQRILKFTQQTLAKTKKQGEDKAFALETAKQQTEYRLQETVRVVKFLQANCKKVADEKTAVEQHVVELQAALAAAQEDCNTAQEKGVEAVALRQKVVKLESDLSVTKRVVEFLQKSMAQTEDVLQKKSLEIVSLHERLQHAEESRSAAANQAFSAEHSLSGLNRTLRFTQSLLTKAVDDKQYSENELQLKVSRTQFKLKETERVLTFLQKKLQETNQAKESKENSLQGQVVQLQFRLTETERVAKFLQNNCRKVSAEQQAVTVRAAELEESLGKIQQELQQEREKVLAKDQVLSDQSVQIDSLSLALTEAETRLLVTNRVTEFLQQTLVEMEEEKRTQEIDLEESRERTAVLEAKVSQAEKDVYAKEFQANEMKRIMKFLESALQKAKSEKEAKEKTLVGTVQDKEGRLVETDRALRDAQSTLMKTKKEKLGLEKELGNKLASLKNHLSNTNSKVKEQQDEVETLVEENVAYEARVKELECELKKMGAQCYDLKKEKESLEKNQDDAAQLKNRLHDLESDKIVGSRLQDFLKEQLMAIEEAKVIQDRRVFGLEQELAVLRNKSHVPADVAVWQRKFVETEAERQLSDHRLKEVQTQLDTLRTHMDSAASEIVEMTH